MLYKTSSFCISRNGTFANTSQHHRLVRIETLLEAEASQASNDNASPCWLFGSESYDTFWERAISSESSTW